MQIAVSSWSFRHALYAGALHLHDIPAAAFDCGIRSVELNDLFLAPQSQGRIARWFFAKPAQSSGPDYGRKTLTRIKQHRLRLGARLVCWTVETDLTLASAEERQAQRAYLGVAIEAARFLGSPILRLTLGGARGERDSLGRAIDLLRSVLPVAMASGVRLAIENHGGLSSEPGSLEEVVTAFPSDAKPIGICLDLGHFAEGDQAAGMTRLAPLAIHVHAPARAFDERGEESTIDYRLSMASLRVAGYAGAISIEYHGDGDPREAIRQTKSVIEKYWQG